MNKQNMDSGEMWSSILDLALARSRQSVRPQGESEFTEMFT